MVQRSRHCNSLQEVEDWMRDVELASTLLLAEAVGPAGHVTGLDISPEFLVHAKEIAKKSGLSEQTSFQEGDVNKLPCDDDTFDWVWSVDCVGDVHAPLSDDIRSALISFFRMLWGERQPEVSQEDWAEYQRLCQSESPDFILNLPDYYAFFTYSMFWGKVAN